MLHAPFRFSLCGIFTFHSGYILIEIQEPADNAIHNLYIPFWLYSNPSPIIPPICAI